MNCVASYVPWVQRNRLWANRLAHTLPNSAYAVGDVRVSEAEQATLAAMAEALGVMLEGVVLPPACRCRRPVSGDLRQILYARAREV